MARYTTIKPADLDKLVLAEMKFFARRGWTECKVCDICANLRRKLGKSFESVQVLGATARVERAYQRWAKRTVRSINLKAK